jgi:diadenosine tetraphosphatase ApaH/serine/threonine PP2A family protein phosphatase
MAHTNNIKPAQRYEANPEIGYMYPCLAGAVCRNDDGSSVYVWALFKRSDIDPSLIEAHNKPDDVENTDEDDEPFDLGMHITGWGPYSNGVGRWFGANPCTIIGRNHVLVRQFRAMDI